MTLVRVYVSVAVLSAVGSFLAVGDAWAEDWPQWRYDAGRTAASPQELPATMHLQWVREYPPLTPAWEDVVNRDRMPFDRVYEPVVMGTRMFVGSSRNDSVIALDTRTGAELWRFYTDGPVRFPPVAASGRVYVVSDDGCLYCLDAAGGALEWKHRGGPAGRNVLGNGRLISAWPARGGPVLLDGIVYFAAGIWPFEGIFICALDAATGKVVWENEETGTLYMKQPHDAPAFGGLAPQGALAAIGDRLLVPGGRTVPACLDRTSGKLEYFSLSGSRIKGGNLKALRKHEGGSHVCGIGDYYFNHRGTNTGLYDLRTGDMYVLFDGTTYPVLTRERYFLSGATIRAFDFGGEKLVEKKWVIPPAWECKVDACRALIKAGSRLYAGGSNSVTAVDLSGVPRASWQAPIEGTPARLLAADDRLFVVTLKGRIYAFGGEPTAAPLTHAFETKALDSSGATVSLARAMVAKAPVPRGYCLVRGVGDGALAASIAANSDLRVIGVDEDADTVAALRRRFDSAGVYGDRLELHVGSPVAFAAPSYFAALTVSETPGLAARDVYDAMRPYGGVAFVRVVDDEGAVGRFAGEAASLAGARVTKADGYAVLRREGALPGCGDWTHMYGDVANTVKSDDTLVKLPLGVLWFGGNTHADVLPRHGHGPPELVIGGRLFIQGLDVLSARDVYTGRVLWRRAFDHLGTEGVYYDDTYVPDPLDQTYNQQHLAGANARGANYAAAPDRLYLVRGDECLALDPATGDTMATFTLPREADGTRAVWGYVGVSGDLLIAGAGAVKFSELTGAKVKIWDNYDSSSSKRLVVMDRHTGTVRWTRESHGAFRHNAIAAGGGKIFCIDAMPKPVLSFLRPKGRAPDAPPELLALNADDGREVWRKQGGAVFGTWLSYSAEHDLLVQCGRPARDSLADEPGKRMMALRGATGEVVWDAPRENSGPPMLHGDTIYLNADKRAGGAVGLLTGEVVERKHPLTGGELPWSYRRSYGCNFGICSEYLLAFRSGAAGFYDLANDGGTGNFGGFKSGCTANLIAADGVLNAPDYTRTCTCTYQNQTSLAMVHRPEVEMWTVNDFTWDGQAVERVGLNFGAPGDRRASDGTLWMDYPSVGGPSPDLPVKVGGEQVRYFHRHSSRIERGEPKWVAASGVTGVRAFAATLGPAGGGVRRYTVKLYFAEPELLGVGDRVFDVALQGQKVLSHFDVVGEAGGPNRTVVKVFTGIQAGGELTAVFTPSAGEPLLCGLEAIVEFATRP